MKGYKVFDSNWKCNGFQYKVGETYIHEGEVEICKSGFHFCQNLNNCFNYYEFNSSNKVAEIEADDSDAIIIGDDKCVCKKIYIIKELKWNEVLELVNSGNCNSGNCNSGNYNSGNNNSGNCNSGNNNSGNCNSGYRNLGNWNSGHNNLGNWNSGHNNSGNNNSGNRNSGNYNSGNYNSVSSNSGNNNSGYRNSGNCNSGNDNSGYRNSGYRNSGNNNSGDCNSGNNNLGYCNSGNCNSGNRNSGMFNSNEPYMRMFNKQTKIKYSSWHKSKYYINFDIILSEWIHKENMTDIEKTKNPEFEITGGYLKTILYKEAWKNWWNGNKDKHEKVKQLPNFDAKIFKEITGIDINKEN
jgi:hypothetical protein